MNSTSVAANATQKPTKVENAQEVLTAQLAPAHAAHLSMEGRMLGDVVGARNGGWNVVRVGRMTRVSQLMAAVVCAGVLAVGGCFQRGNYPEIPTSEGFAENPNKPANEQAMIAALQYVGSRWTPGQRMFDPTIDPAGLPMINYPCVINLPQGTRKSMYERVARKAGPQVLAATPEVVEEAAAQGWPTFHVTRVWMRFNKGWVDVLRPMPEMGLGADGKPVHQLVTVHLEGGNKPWRVVYARSWPPGQMSPPQYAFVPAVDDPNQFAITQRELRARASATLDADPYNRPQLAPIAPQEGEVPTQVVIEPMPQ